MTYDSSFHLLLLILKNMTTGHTEQEGAEELYQIPVYECLRAPLRLSYTSLYTTSAFW